MLPPERSTQGDAATEYTMTLPAVSYYFRMSTIDSNSQQDPISPAIHRSIQNIKFTYTC